MKASRYLHYLERGDQSYWYNAMENTYFKIPASIGRKLKSLIDSKTGIESLPSPLYEKLLNGKFIIDENYDELQEIRRRYAAEVNNKKAHLIILPTLNCNYSCWYCIQDHIVSAMSDETMNRIKEYINNLINAEKIESLHVDWFGGEPFMYFDKVIKPLSEYIIDRCEKANIPFTNGATTNGYFLSNQIIANLSNLKFTIFQITLDGNKEFHDKVKYSKGLTSAFDHTLKNINDLLIENKDIQIVLRINYTHKNLKPTIVKEVCSQISPEIRKYITIFPRKVWQEEVDKSFFKTLYPILADFENNGFKVEYWSPITTFVPCYASRKSYIGINYNGNIIKCTANDDMYSDNPMAKINEYGIIEWYGDQNESYSKPSFENPRCLRCNLLPACMGICPRERLNGSKACKLKESDIEITNSIIEYVDYMTR